MADKPPSLDDAHKRLFDEGLKIRYEVAGKPYVDRSLQSASSFTQPMQELVTEACWGSVWSRPGLERKQRSLLNIGMLCALNRGAELAVHVRGGVNNGLTEIEIREALLQVSIYVGMPAGLEGFRIAEKPSSGYRLGLLWITAGMLAMPIAHSPSMGAHTASIKAHYYA
ncbi:hypothetical protein ACN38_g11241 [Penicillium nordicum]|uniref:Carboxymuconolactone decarboxylase-like domain-containing protein n=1 Tax=Penicillium nordicum TaxID=229535 RepID=A0A0M8P0J5_9EURO|nr:hypothetical protein ACN38_g11241 [Penicillium nordicum]